MNTYDLIFLADDEWDNDTMARVAREHFAANPRLQFVQVYEHGGWWLGYRRDGTIFATANDAAVLDRGPRPDGFSGVSIRRQCKPKAAEVAA